MTGKTQATLISYRSKNLQISTPMIAPNITALSIVYIFHALGIAICVLSPHSHGSHSHGSHLHSGFSQTMRYPPKCVDIVP